MEEAQDIMRRDRSKKESITMTMMTEVATINTKVENTTEIEKNKKALNFSGLLICI